MDKLYGVFAEHARKYGVGGAVDSFDSLPPDQVSGLTDLFTEIMDGHNSYLTDGVQRAVGRPPRDFTEYATRTAATGVWNS